MENKYRRLAENTLLVFIGKFGSGIITFLMLPLYTHWLSPDSYGTAELINTYANILVSIATICLADAIFIFPKTSDKIGKKKYYSTGLLVALLCFFFVFFLLSFINKNTNCFGNISDNIYQIFALSLSIFLQSYTQQFTRSIDKMKVYSLSGVVQTILVAVFAFLFIPNWGPKGYIYSFVAANLMSSIFTFCVSKSYKYLSIYYFDKNSAINLLKYGIPLIPNSIMWWLVDGVNKPIMNAYLGLSAIGIYAVASKFPSVLNVVVNAFSNAWGISVSEEYGKSNFNLYFNEIFKVIFFILVLFSMIISIFSDVIISIFASSEYAEASDILPVLLLGVIFSNASALFGGIFMARKQSKYFFYSSVFGAVASLISLMLFIKPFGIYGVAYSTVVSFCVMSISRAIYVWNDINKIEVKYYLISIIHYIIFLILHNLLKGFWYYGFLVLLLYIYLLLNKPTILKIKEIYRKFNLKKV